MSRAKSLAIAAISMLAVGANSVAASAGTGASKRRALVLGGGGPVGEAWEDGVIAGLAEDGVDLSQADLIVGTSAGAVVGARLARGKPEDLMSAEALAPPEGPPPRPGSTLAKPGPPPDLSMLFKKFSELAARTRPPELIRAEIGTWALKAPPVIPEEIFVASYMRRFPEKRWPARAFECIAVDTADGSLKVWNKDSGAPLARAVASSCAFPGIFAPVAIDGHRYMDGGMRSVTNADLANGYATVVILAPTVGQTDEIGKHFQNLTEMEVKGLRAGGSNVVMLAPDGASLRSFGPTLTDSSRRAAAAAAGLTEGRAQAAALRGAWRD